ncbi:MAG: hypothetical protein Q7K57_03535 [Burkholderiaceae bacterium]|nr:hypothetical protein [Burkholderiaceae bacterium]
MIDAHGNIVATFQRGMPGEDGGGEMGPLRNTVNYIAPGAIASTG